MLHLKRNIRFNELYKCKLSGEWIAPGDYYYEDDEDGTIIKATVYREMKKKQKIEEFDYSKLENAKSELDYRMQLRKAEMEFLRGNILERKVYGKER